MAPPREGTGQGRMNHIHESDDLVKEREAAEAMGGKKERKEGGK